jgi:hypothetical protein
MGQPGASDRWSDRPYSHLVLTLEESCPQDDRGGSKKGSSKWLKTQGSQFRDFHWQNGYGAFSVSQSNVPEVRRYIEEQKEHHRRMTFQEEFRKFLKRHGMEFDERYVWD